MMFLRINFVCLLFLSFLSVSAKPIKSRLELLELEPSQDSMLVKANIWADSILRSMDWDQKVGQLFMVEAYSNRDEEHMSSLLSMVDKQHIGGVIFFQGSPHKQARMTNMLQQSSKVPLLIGIDGEWGLSMRLDSTVRFPRQMTLGANKSDTLIYAIGKEIARQCKRMGIHINFAPVVDVNSNPLNPVISSRSFGEDKRLVTRLATQYMNGMQDNGVLACAKHFPGHGNTDSDSHYTLPFVKDSASSIDSVELFPFKSLIRDNVASVMVAHLSIPALDTVPNRATSLSPFVVDTLLRQRLGFQGLVFTDALNMKGVADYYEPGELAVLALQAGNDVLLFSRDVPAAWMRVRNALEQCEIDSVEIDRKVRRILIAKFMGGLNHYSPINLEGLTKDLNTPWAEYLAKTAYEKSLVLLNNKNGSIPIRMGNHCSMASLTINDDSAGEFFQSIASMAPVSKFNAIGDMGEAEIANLVKELEGFDYVVAGIHNTNIKSANGYGIPSWADRLLLLIGSKTNLITVVFGNSYSLSRVPSAKSYGSLVLAHEDTRISQSVAADLIFGISGTNSTLPVSPLGLFTAGDGLPIRSSMLRLREAYPYEVGMSPKDFNAIDSIANKLIADQVAPGCQVLVAWKDRIVYHKSFGRQTYDANSREVALTDLYDIASVTKIAATALAAMKLVDEGKLDIHKPASAYFKELRKTNKKDLLISDIMTHTAGLKSWIPFWTNTVDSSGSLSYDFYHKVPDANYNIPVCDSLFISRTYEDLMWKEIFKSDLGTKGKLVYSDLGLLIMQQVIEHITKVPLDEYVYKNFYEPMGLVNILYKPLNRISIDRIPPTEMDSAFRGKLVHGYVHDPAAAMLGGVAGHAGLFSDSYSLAVVMQMLLNGGEYGGKRYINSQTVRQFTSKSGSGDLYRGLLFDKPDARKGIAENTARLASSFTFGHTGFTGTAAWADPEQDIIFIFLSNRVNPNAEPNKLSKGKYRPSMMQAAYEIILRNAGLPKSP
ncbi:MAG: glycoside hydrolase family 3 N-terminal domain-containing protein [Arcticibacter sp.]